LLSSSAGATISGTSEPEGRRKKYPGKNTNKNAPIPIAAKMAIRMSVNRLRVEKYSFAAATCVASSIDIRPSMSGSSRTGKIKKH